VVAGLGRPAAYLKAQTNGGTMDIWLLSVGGSSTVPIAVYVGAKRGAVKAASAIKTRRIGLGVSSDLVDVQVQPVKCVNEHGEVAK
jgi:hypothetical protein